MRSPPVRPIAVPPMEGIRHTTLPPPVLTGPGQGLRDSCAAEGANAVNTERPDNDDAAAETTEGAAGRDAPRGGARRPGRGVRVRGRRRGFGVRCRSGRRGTR
ncbi:hypothetical protein GCM10020256_56780 [Streptomyces thermocoprophilus]